MGFMDKFLNTISNVERENKNDTEPFKNSLNRFQPFNEEFSLDMTTEPYGSDMASINNSYSNSGVELSDARNTLRLVYKGILAKSGAEEINAVIGYGNNLSWEDTTHYPMKNNNDQTFELMLPVTRTGNINIAFTDLMGNWDNNSGQNYSFVNFIYEGSH